VEDKRKMRSVKSGSCCEGYPLVYRLACACYATVRKRGLLETCKGDSARARYQKTGGSRVYSLLLAANLAAVQTLC